MRKSLLVATLVPALVACVARKKSDDDEPATTPIDTPEKGVEPGTGGDDDKPKSDPTVGARGACFASYYEEVAVQSNFDFKPACARAEFGMLGYEGFGTPGKIFLYEWSVELQEPRAPDGDDVQTIRTLGISYWGGEERKPAKVGKTYTGVYDPDGFFRAHVNGPGDDYPGEGGGTFEVTVLEAPTTKGSRVRLKFSISRPGKLSGQPYEVSGAIDLPMCNEPNQTKNGCDYTIRPTP